MGNMLTRFGLSMILRESLMAGNFAVMASTEVMILVVMAVIFRDDEEEDAVY